MNLTAYTVCSFQHVLYFLNLDDKGHRKKQPGNQSSSTSKKYDDCSPIVQAFYTYQADLDKKHDRYERLVKLSRDVTIESKRVIFLLQRVSG